ncbi:acyl CoA dehydrogenase 6-like protein [Sarcoptes scabiei]|uniref:Acyl CoA dehydrogenase 6-like protein n=1 Tax=Sarcoptes scabiei TaxID=52283 RepID=A0A131ZZS7_SARSC|nr:acyl CoA dehydrogenase 6-like protein [Sarcoptes scabiei]
MILPKFRSKIQNVLRQSIRTVTFTEQHEQVRQTIQKIIDKDINPFVDEWELQGQFPAHTVFKKLGDAGLLGITRDPKYKGLGLDYSFSAVLFEELSRINCGGIPSAIEVQTDMALPALATFGSDYLKEQFLMPSITGEYVACVGVSEPSGGSDVAALKTHAKTDGDDLIISGSKMWITNGTQADWMCALINTKQGPIHKNKSLVCIPLKSPGVFIQRKIRKIGLHSSDTAEIIFDNVRVPRKNIIGEEGQGFTYQMLQFQEERLCVAITAVEVMNRIIRETIEYCRQRKAFDSFLIDNQYIYFRLAELQSENVTYIASIAKLKCGRLIREVVDQCLQYYGGMGFTEDMPIGRAYRDNRVISIAGGTDEMMLSIIANAMGILPKRTRVENKKL